MANSKKRARWPLVFLLALLSLAAACPISIVLPAQPSSSEEPDLALTMTALALMQTQIALQKTLQAPTPTTAALPLPSPTWPPVASPLPTATLAPTQPPAATATTSRTELSGTATGNLYCRTGPAPYYPKIDTLSKGNRVTVLARAADAETDYWLVRTPSGDVCWVWGRWLSIEGDKTALPIATAPPPPPGAFSIGLRKQDTCAGVRYLVFVVVNRGPKPLESIQIRVKDIQTGNTFEIPVLYRNSFFGCTENPDALAPNREAEVWVPIGAIDLSGRTVQVTAQACTKDDFQGECVQRTPFLVKVP